MEEKHELDEKVLQANVRIAPRIPDTKYPLPLRTAKEGGTRIVGECEMYEEERGVLEEEMGQIYECDLEKFGHYIRARKRSLSQEIGFGHKRQNRKSSICF